jgi:hypothetical protein
LALSGANMRMELAGEKLRLKGKPVAERVV